jgi:hypothetical protein
MGTVLVLRPNKAKNSWTASMLEKMMVTERVNPRREVWAKGGFI